MGIWDGLIIAIIDIHLFQNDRKLFDIDTYQFNNDIYYYKVKQDTLKGMHAYRQRQSFNYLLRPINLLTIVLGKYCFYKTKINIREVVMKLIVR